MGSRSGPLSMGGGGSSRVPKVPFPQFDGENPKLWISRCENYFDMFPLESHMRIKFATMHFSGAAARWLQSVKKRLRSASWDDFIQLLLDRFGREQQEVLICQLFHVRQSGLVSEYVEQFTELVDQLTAYNHVQDPLYYTMHFIDGLKPDIRAVVLVQRPKDLDTAYSLAILQEEVSDSARRCEFKKPDSGFYPKSSTKGALPLPPPPSQDKQSTPVHPDEKKLCEGKSVEDKLRALRAYRRAKGLCIKCAERWSRDHVCSPTVELHAMQEVLDLFNVEELDDSASVHSQSPSQFQLFLALSVHAATGSEGPRTMRLQGSIQGIDLLILIDSGSSHSFLSQRIADRCPRPVVWKDFCKSR